MSIIIRCDREDLKLKFRNHFLGGGFVIQAPQQNAEYANEVNAIYNSNVFRKRFEGALICQVQPSEAEFPNDTFIMAGWEAPLFGSAQIYIILVEARNKGAKWNSNSIKYQHKLFYNRLRKYTGVLPTYGAWEITQRSS
jgi:hypothetical protein